MLKKYILTYCLFFVTLVLIAQTREDALTEAEQMPYFPGCEHLKKDAEDKRNCSNQAIVNYIANNLKYPSSAKTAGIEGTVYVSFDINENGYVSRVSSLNKINEACEREAVKVIQNMPRWEPAMNEWQTSESRVEYSNPFLFKRRINRQGFNLSNQLGRACC